MNRLIAAAPSLFLSALVFSPSAGADAPGPVISPAQAKSWHATYMIEKPKTAADKAWNTNRKKLPIEGSITAKSMDLKINKGGEYPLTFKSDEEERQYSPGIIDGTWTDIDKGESGIFRASYDNQRAAYVIDMGKGYKTHDSYGDYTVTLQRKR